MSSTLRFVAAISAAGLFAWMLALFATGSTLTADSAYDQRPALSYECESIAPYLFGNPGNNDMASGSGPHYSFVPSDGKPLTVTPDSERLFQTVNGLCDGKRTAFASLIGLLAVPAAILAAIALRRREPAQSQALGPPA